VSKILLSHHAGQLDYPLKLGQPPALGQAWHLVAGAGSLTTAAKVENCFSHFFSPHCGQAGALLDADLTNASFTNPQDGHLYSNIGILTSKTLIFTLLKVEHHIILAHPVKIIPLEMESAVRLVNL
jgi:hypothetical protein